MSFNIVVSSSFKKHVKGLSKKYHSLKSDIAHLISTLEDDPTQGDPLGKDCYKIRMAIASKGKGKRGGARVITCVKIVGENVYLLALYDKSEKENLADGELDDLLRIAFP